MDVEHLWFTTCPPSPTKMAAAEGRSRATEGPRADPQGATGGSGPPPPLPLGRPPPDRGGGHHHFKWQWRPERKGPRASRPSADGGEENDDAAAGCGPEGGGGRGEGGRERPGGEDMVQTLTMMTDQMLYKLVKWCKSLPLFKNILVRVLIPLFKGTVSLSLNFLLLIKHLPVLSDVPLINLSFIW